MRNALGIVLNRSSLAKALYTVAFPLGISAVRHMHFIRQPQNPLPLPHQTHLPLHLIPEIKVPSVERMHSHIPILPATCIPSPQRIHRNCIQRAEMPLHAADFIFEYLVVEAGFKFALPG